MAWAVADVASHPNYEAFRKDMKEKFAADIPEALFDLLRAKGSEAVG